MVKQVQEYQLSFSVNTTTEIVSALGALPLKGNCSTTKQRKWQSLSFKYRYYLYHLHFRLLQFDDVPLKVRQFSMFSPFNFKQ